MLAKIGTQKLLDDKELIFEPKLDGYRALCQYTGKSYRLYSRRGIDITDQFPELNVGDRIHAENCILDGEIIAYNKKGFPDFRFIEGRSELSNQNQIKERVKKHPATYAVFDILVKDGKSLMKKPFIERHKILAKTISPSKRVELLRSTHDGKKLFAYMKKHKLEGVMAKEPYGIYSPGKRTKAWQKVKLMKSVECVIVGYTEEKKLISSLALGLYDKNKKLIYVGRVGTGFSETKIKELYPLLRKNRATKSATTTEPKIKGLLFVKPKLVAEVRYLEMTPTGSLRHASYLHYRDDKKPHSCTFDQIT
jgi:bifunctional non-homologous end joining protein LigD